MVNPNLEFRKVKSLKFLYEVSEDGRYVRNVKSKKYLLVKHEKHHSKKGYWVVWINNIRITTGNPRRFPVHQLVAECWLGDRPEGTTVDHIDRDTSNNHYTNLRYATHSEQMKNRQLGAHVIAQATANCFAYVMSISVGVRLTASGESKDFRSMAQAAYFIGETLGENSECSRTAMKKRRAHYKGFDITYLNAETAC